MEKPAGRRSEFATQNNGGWGNNFVHDESIRRFGFPLTRSHTRLAANTDFNSRAAITLDNYPWILDPAYSAASQGSTRQGRG